MELRSWVLEHRKEGNIEIKWKLLSCLWVAVVIGLGNESALLQSTEPRSYMGLGRILF